MSKLTDLPLKPCPFCGSSVDLEQTTTRYSEIHGQRTFYGVKCRSTLNVGGSCAIETVPSASIKAAVERWNMRAPNLTLVRMVKARIGSGWVECGDQAYDEAPKFDRKIFYTGA